MKLARTLCALLLASPVGLGARARNEATSTLAPAQAVARHIGLTQTHVYEFAADAGQFIRFDVTQTNVDPVLTIADADGRQLREMYFERLAGRTAISFVAPARASFRVRVKPSGASKTAGSYRLQMSTPRTATEADRRRVEAEAALNAVGFMAREVGRPGE